MSDSTRFSLRTRMRVARLAQLIRKYDRVRTELNDDAALVALLRRAADDSRADVRQRFEETVSRMDPDERDWLQTEQVPAVDDSVNEVPAAAETDQPVMMYRGQVVRR